MKKYIFTLIALSMIFTATARKPKNTRTTEAASVSGPRRSSPFSTPTA